MSRYAKRVDTNHGQIKEVFESFLSGHVTDCSAFGSGVGDLYVSYAGFGVFVEIKKDDKAELTAAQIRFNNLHPGCCHRVETVDQAVKLCQWIRKGTRLP